MSESPTGPEGSADGEVVRLANHLLTAPGGQEDDERPRIAARLQLQYDDQESEKRFNQIPERFIADEKEHRLCQGCVTQ